MTLEPRTAKLRTGVSLDYVDEGDGPGVVLFVPGPTDSWRSYAQVLAQLPPSVRGIAVSPRGHGDSDKPSSGYDVAHFARDVVALLDALDVASATLVGHSGSCLVVRRVAIDHPDRVGGLVLEASPTTLARDAGLRGFVEPVLSDLADPIPADFARSFVVDTSSGNVTDDDIAMLTAELRKVPARVWHEMFGDLLTYDDLDELSAIRAPSLLVWGERDTIVRRAMQDELLLRLPNASLVTYPGVGHTPRWEDPRRFADDVATFV